MSKKFISIQLAAELSNKSIQTIRRAIKARKLKCRKQKTPQGFNYLISQDSLVKAYKLKLEETDTIKTEAPKKKKLSVKKSGSYKVSADDFKSFALTLEKMMNQHSEERQNFLRLVDTLQEKIFVLENQLNLLKAPSKKWYQVWK